MPTTPDPSTPRRGPAIALVGAVAGLALLTGAILLSGAPAAAGLAGASSSAAAEPAAQPVAAPVDGPGAATAPGAVAGSAAERAVPVRLRVERAGGGTVLDAPVVPVGVDPTGDMAVPFDIRTVGWYGYGPAPGDPAGSAVVAGHVDDRVQGLGAFHDLVDLVPGDRVTVERTDAPPVEMVVREVRAMDKADVPLDELFARDGEPRLTLVTCGGTFDTAARSYRENVIVVAVPVAAP